VRHFLEELDELQAKLLEMAGLVEAAVHGSVAALEDRDDARAQEVLRNETRVNRLEIEIDDLAVRLLALHQPMARDLRFLTAAIKINGNLERMGDLAVNIAERALSLNRQPPIQPLIDVPQMAKLVESMVRRSLDAFVRRDSELARAVLLSDDAVDDFRDWSGSWSRIRRRFPEPSTSSSSPATSSGSPITPPTSPKSCCF
jgi:phosphate transport system protein